ncbi:MAG: hypothetical protein WC496_02075 [Phycisphaerae bacterium]|jgi:hypothetical protein
MARNLKHVALYELINKTRFKNAQQKALERIGVVNAPIQKQQEEKPEAVSQVEKPVPASVSVPVQAEAVKTDTVKNKPEFVWTGKPKPVRVYPDRIELCFSWQVAGIAVLAFFAILMVFFRLGQIYSPGKSPETNVSKPVTTVSRPVEIVPDSVKPAAAERNVTAQNPPKMVEPMGDNVIVITSYPLSSHLEPVKQYFAQFGIATEIIKRGSRYLLVTQNRFDGIDKSGTDGYEMKRKIMSVGANYKPPAGSGFESFGTKPFQDVYAMKMN